MLNISLELTSKLKYFRSILKAIRRIFAKFRVFKPFYDIYKITQNPMIDLILILTKATPLEFHLNQYSDVFPSRI